MRVIKEDGYLLLVDKVGRANFVFSTGEMNININVDNIEEHKEILLNIFPVKDIGYLRQCHSDIVYEYNNKIKDGDGIFTEKRDIALGVFTADCVPILIYDKKLNIIAAVHSGWRGTYNKIVVKAINKIISEKGSKIEDIIIYIGPHIHQCCYEIGEELKNKLIDAGAPEKAFSNRNLSLSYLIRDDLDKVGIIKENIYEVNYCTECTNQFKFHSYRRDKEFSGRNFSFVYVED